MSVVNNSFTYTLINQEKANQKKHKTLHFNNQGDRNYTCLHLQFQINMEY